MKFRWVGANGKRTKRFSSENGKTDQTVRGGAFFLVDGSTFGTLYCVWEQTVDQTVFVSKRSKNGPNTNPFFRLLQISEAEAKGALLGLFCTVFKRDQ
jgi:hypothetical protein